MNTSPWDTLADTSEVLIELPSVDELHEALRIARVEVERKIEHGRPKRSMLDLRNVLLD